MSILDNLEPTDKSVTCRLVQIADKLEPTDSAVLFDALADKVKWSSNGLAEALNKRGINVSAETIRRHRIGVCPCRKFA